MTLSRTRGERVSAGCHLEGQLESGKATSGWVWEAFPGRTGVRAPEVSGEVLPYRWVAPSRSPRTRSGESTRKRKVMYTSSRRYTFCGCCTREYPAPESLAFHYRPSSAAPGELAGIQPLARAVSLVPLQFPWGSSLYISRRMGLFSLWLYKSI